MRFLRKHGIPDSTLERYETRTVLVADDDPDVLEFLTTELTEAFPMVRVVTVTNGYDALIQVGVLKPDLLILDIHMPQINGIEVYERLKNAEAARHIRILAISGYEYPEFEELIRKSHGDLFLRKPIKSRRLVEAVSMQLKLSLAKTGC